MKERRALVVSPTPSHPADHGHRNRVRQTTAMLVAAGYVTDFLLYPMDDDWRDAVPPGLVEMQAAWGGRRGGVVLVAPPSRELHLPPAGAHHALDEWWDPAIEAPLNFLCARRAYDVMLVNYLFLSRAFLHAPAGCRRALDTHDRLSGRRELFEAHGAAPEFFYLTEAEEARGLARADIVLAIKPAEAAHFRRLTDRTVITLPFAPARSTPRPPPAAFPDGTKPLRAGFIGADNSVNARNLAAFLGRLAVWIDLYLPDLTVIVAGNVCRRVAPAPDFVTLLGRVDDTGGFYGAIDVIVAPIAFSTGLKIKVAEALAHGCPVIATAHAFDGFAPADPWHTLDDIDAVCGALVALAADRGRLARLAAASRRAAAASRRAAAHGAAQLREALLAPAPPPRIVANPAAPIAPMRRLPPPRLAAPPLDAPEADPPFAIVVIETAEAAEDRAADAVARAVCGACARHRLAVLRTADVARDPHLRAALEALPAPSALAGIDLTPAARDRLGRLAADAGAAFFPLGGPYPLLAAGAAPMLVRHLREHIAALDRFLSATPTAQDGDPVATGAGRPVRHLARAAMPVS